MLRVFKLVVILFLFGSCVSGEILTDHDGTVIHVDENSVTVAYKCYRSTRHGYLPVKNAAVNAFYYPFGHNYKKGDIYP